MAFFPLLSIRCLYSGNWYKKDNMMGNTNLNSTTLEIKIDKKIAKRFKYALECSQATAKVEVYKILLSFVQNFNEQLLENSIKYLDKTIKERSLCQHIKLHELLDFQDNKGNTLLHYVASHSQHKNIKTLIKYDANPLIKNMNNQIPLDLAQGQTREELIKGMMEQASSKKESSRYDALGRTFAVSCLAFIVFGVGVSIAAECDVVSFPSAILGAIIASPLVGVAAGLITYFLDHDRKQAKAISTILQESEVSKKSPSLQSSEI